MAELALQGPLKPKTQLWPELLLSQLHLWQLQLPYEAMIVKIETGNRKLVSSPVMS